MKNDNNGWQVKSLGEVVTDIRYGMTASADFLNDGIKFLRVTDITANGSVDYNNLPNVVTKKSEAKNYFLLNGDCVIARSGSVGKAHIFSGIEEVVFASYLIRLRFNKEILYPPYFGAFSQTRLYWNQIISNTKGGVQQNINTEGLSRIKIPLPPLPIQKQIAEILEKADEAKQKRKEANKLTDEFLQSVFIDMFGDPVKNPKEFKIVTIGDVITDVKDGPHVSPNYVNEGIPILSTRNVRPGSLVLEDVKYVSEEHYNYLTRYFKPRTGDVLLTKGGTTGYAKVVDFDWPFCVWVHIAVLRPKSIIHPQYLESALNSDYCYQQSRLYTHGIANHDLGLTRIIKIKLLLPPYALQQQFAEIVNKTEALKAKQKQSEQELENLFQSLMQKAFKGELVS